MSVQLKRVFDEADPSDGFRVLVDRLWPRGISKERAAIELWLKDVAPSPDLRKEWHHNPGRFDEFAARYRGELDDNPAVGQLGQIIADHATVTLVYGAKDPVVNHAAVLRDYLAER